MLDKYKSMCQERQKIIVSRDQGAARVHQARNVDSDLVRHYQIDGYVICDPSVRKCDFLLLDDTKKKAYLIEVKGTDIKHAVGQLELSVWVYGPVVSSPVISGFAELVSQRFFQYKKRGNKAVADKQEHFIRFVFIIIIDV